MNPVSDEDLLWENYIEQHDDEFDFAFWCMVYDPCDRPGHFPHSDAWLRAKEQRVKDVILDWLSSIAWDWDQVTVEFDNGLSRTMFINEFVSFTTTPLAFVDYNAASLIFVDKASGQEFHFDTLILNNEVAYFYIWDSFMVALEVIDALYTAGTQSTTTFTPQYFAGDGSCWNHYSRSPQPFRSRIMNSLDGLQEALSELPQFRFQLSILSLIENNFCEIIRRGHERIFGSETHSTQTQNATDVGTYVPTSSHRSDNGCHNTTSATTTVQIGKELVPMPPNFQRIALVHQLNPLTDPQTHLNKNATFDTFVPGDSNRFARTVALAVAEGSGQDFNPLCIYGGSGLGKTHLLNAIGNYALVKDPTLKVRYVTSEEFTNEFIDALQNPSQSQGRIAEFNRRYRQVDVLLIDDIQFLGGKEATLEQFFHTFNSLYQAGKRIVIASDVAPKNLKGFQQSLIARLQSGIVVGLNAPSLETRTAILRMTATMHGYDIPAETIDLLVEQYPDDIRTLKGALTRLAVIATLTGQSMTAQFTKRELGIMA